MASSSRACNIETCKRSARALCICCQEYLCLDHLKVHSDLLNAQLTPLADEINKLYHQSGNSSLLQPSFLVELDGWRQAAHRIIDQFYARKRREYEKFIGSKRAEQKAKLDRLRDRVNELIREQDGTQEHIDSINDSIRRLHEQTTKSDFAHFKLPPLVIDDHLVAIYGENSVSKDLLPLPPAYRVIKRSGVSGLCIAANDNHLLMINDSKLCLLDRQLIIRQEMRWTYNELFNMFWSKALNQFILVTSSEIFTLDQQSMTFQQCPIIFNNNRLDRYRGTCTDNNLCLSSAKWGASIYQYVLRPEIQFVKEYRSPISCTRDEYICDLSSNNIALAIIIRNRQNEERLDLCSSETFQRQWSLQLWSIAIHWKVRCCPINKNQWLAMNPNPSELIHISADGELIKRDNYTAPPHHAVQLGNDVLAISTGNNFNFHRLV